MTSAAGMKSTVDDSVKYLDKIIHEDVNSQEAKHHQKIFDMMKHNEEKFGKIEHPVPFGHREEKQEKTKQTKHEKDDDSED